MARRIEESELSVNVKSQSQFDHSRSLITVQCSRKINVLNHYFHVWYLDVQHVVEKCVAQ